MSVHVAQQVVLNSTPESWLSEGVPVTLSSGQQIPIRVDFAYQRTAKSSSNKAPMAILYWEGPGVTKAVIPSNALYPSSGSGQGLLAVYRSGGDGVPKTWTQVDPEIDHIWLLGRAVVPTHPAAEAAVAQSLRLAAATSPAYLATSGTVDPAAVKDLYNILKKLAGYLSSQQRASLLQDIADRPALLSSFTWDQLERIYYFYRTGSPDEALDLIGQWSQLHPDAECVISEDFYTANRKQYRDVTIALVWQHRSHSDRLEQRYLVMPDGGCCLPVAYTLGYGHLVLGTIGDWIGQLDGQLDNSELTGDRRAGWLLARAQAEEIRYGRPDRHVESKEHIFAGRQWLEEATLVAQTEPVKLRANKELLARLATYQVASKAGDFLDGVEQRFTTDASAAVLAEWRTELQEVAAEHQRRQDERREIARRGYLDSLSHRLQRAIDRDDTISIERYQGLLKKAGEPGDVATP